MPPFFSSNYILSMNANQFVSFQVHGQKSLEFDSSGANDALSEIWCHHANILSAIQIQNIWMISRYQLNFWSIDSTRDSTYEHWTFCSGMRTFYQLYIDFYRKPWEIPCVLLCLYINLFAFRLVSRLWLCEKFTCSSSLIFEELG